MTDYAEEQANEIEALESIYPEEFQLIDTSPTHCFQLPLCGEAEGIATDTVSCTLQFTYTEQYPDTAPVMEVLNPNNLTDSDVTDLQELLKEQAEENLGMVMIFTLVSAVQDKLVDFANGIAKRKEEEKEEEQRKIEEAEKKKFEGTRVTIESFLAWKAKFDAEIAEIKKRSGQLEKETNKLTGKELFMKDNTLDDSDVKFFEAEGDAVHVDESLFEDMEDLELDDEIDANEEDR